MNRVTVLSASAKVQDVRADATAAAAAVVPHDSTLYVIQPVEKLPVIDLTHTVAGQLAGPRRAKHVNAFVRWLAKDHHTVWYALTAPFSVGCVLVFLADGTANQALVSVAITLSIMPVLVVHGAELCWDLLRLTVTMFEFWFVFAVNSLGNVCWDLLFPLWYNWSSSSKTSSVSSMHETRCCTTGS